MKSLKHLGSSSEKGENQTTDVRYYTVYTHMRMWRHYSKTWQYSQRKCCFLLFSRPPGLCIYTRPTSYQTDEIFLLLYFLPGEEKKKKKSICAHKVPSAFHHWTPAHHILWDSSSFSQSAPPPHCVRLFIIIITVSCVCVCNQKKTRAMPLALFFFFFFHIHAMI